jgi:hypothetical protein
MLFGTKELFAIEAMSEPELQAPSAVWGRMRVWCEGWSIGNYEEPFCALYPAYCGFKDLARTLPDLWCQELEGLADFELWNHFDGLLYGFHGDIELQDDRTLEQYQHDSVKWGDYNFLTNWGEQFDNGGKSFILCKPYSVVCILNRSLPSERGICRRAPLKEVLNATHEFIEWFKSESLRLGVPADA